MLSLIFGFLGRVCLSAIFVLAGVNKILDWEGTEQRMIDVLSKQMIYMRGVDWIENTLDFLLSYVSVLQFIVVGLEIVGGLLVLIGFKKRLGAFLLIIFLIPVTLIAHPFWALQGAEQELQTVQFLKNLAILGGLFYLIAYGKGGSWRRNKGDFVALDN